MSNFKIVIADPKTRKAYQKEVEQARTGLNGKKIGEKIQGASIDLPGYEFEITGGSDKEGFPMRKDVAGTGRKRIVLTFPPGFRSKTVGQRKRKSVRGNTISQDVVQVNLKVVGHGQKSLDELFGKTEKKEEKKAEEKKPEHKAEKHEEAKEKPKAEPKKE